MSTPLLRAVEEYLRRNPARFHMPGHKGVMGSSGCLSIFGDVLRYDITEVAGADSLYEAAGPIAETESAYAGLYGTAGSFLSAGGSTLCIQAMLALVRGSEVPRQQLQRESQPRPSSGPADCGAAPPAAKPPGAAGANAPAGKGAGSGRGGKILCARGVHTAAVNAMALLDMEPVWIFPEADPLTGLSAPVSPEQVEAALTAHPDASGVYLTSPTYYGVLSDVGAIAALCGAHGVPLLVDNAHGSHLKFLPESLHPMDHGADLCCDSLHKTLPVLTGGALLHVGNPAYLADAKKRMSLFGSTSPSYLILLSADTVLPYLREGVAADLARTAERIIPLKRLAEERGLLLPREPCDPIRLTVGFSPLGMGAGEFRRHLARHGVEPELCADGWCVLLAGGASSEEDFARLRDAILALPAGSPAQSRPPEDAPPPRQAVPLREAVFAPWEMISVSEAAGRIAASAVSACPPGIPLALPGEEIDESLTIRLKRYGILSLPVLK